MRNRLSLLSAVVAVVASIAPSAHARDFRDFLQRKERESRDSRPASEPSRPSSRNDSSHVGGLLGGSRSSDRPAQVQSSRPSGPVQERAFPGSSSSSRTETNRTFESRNPFGAPRVGGDLNRPLFRPGGDLSGPRVIRQETLDARGRSIPSESRSPIFSTPRRDAGITVNESRPRFDTGSVLGSAGPRVTRRETLDARGRPMQDSSRTPIFSTPSRDLGGVLGNSRRRIDTGSTPGSSRPRVIESRRFQESQSGRPGPLFGSRSDGVTDVGRALGYPRPVDDQGRTEIGRALGGVSSAPKVFFQPRAEPVFGYNTRSGGYEPYRSDSGLYVGVLLGSQARRPIHQFRYRSTPQFYYYPYYCNNSADYGYSVFPSLYAYYQTVPSYIPAPHVIVIERPTIIRDDNYGDDDTYYLNRDVGQTLDSAMSDLRRAWTLGDIDLLLRHVRTDQEVHVYLKGKYAYSLPPEDYRDLTQDAMKNTTTTTFRWTSIDRLSNDEVDAEAEHVFEDSDGTRRTVIATFTLVRVHGAWWIAEVGSSKR